MLEAPPLEMQFPAFESHTQPLKKKTEKEFEKEIKEKLSSGSTAAVGIEFYSLLL